MDIKTILLYGAFAIVSFNLWSDWKHEHPSTPSEIALPVQTQQAPSASNETPSEHQPFKVDNVNATSRMLHIKTDVLNIQLDLDSGAMMNAELIKYPATEGSQEPFVLFSEDVYHQYFATTEFVTMDNQNPQNVKIHFTSTQNQYDLANQNELKVVLQGLTDNNVQIDKVYRFKRGSYVVNIDYKLHNLATTPWKAYLNQQLVWKNPVVPESSMFQIGSFTGASFGQPGKHRYKKVSFEQMQKENLDVEANGGWVAMQQHYFLTAWVPNQTGLNRLYTQTKKGEYVIGSVSEPYTLNPNDTLNLNSQLYVGPEDTSVLKQLAPGLDLTVDYGWLWFLSDALFSFMKKINYVIGNWGWSIVLITVLIKAMFFRLSASSYRSMANMRRLQPKLEGLKQRFGDDKAKFSHATMELYKQEKVNPLGGCLPILVQIPVFIALYWVLVESVELRHAPFILWIKDLSAADPYHVLPMIMGLTMLIQQKLNPTPPDPTQAKVMMMMPVFFTILFWAFPAGLVLYWIVNNSLSILQQWWITKKYADATPAKVKA